MRRTLVFLVWAYIILGVLAGLEVFHAFDHDWRLWGMYAWMLLGMVLLEIALSRYVKISKKRDELQNRLEQQEAELSALQERVNSLEATNETMEEDEDVFEKLVENLTGPDEASYFKSLLKVLADGVDIVQGIVFKRGDDDVFRVLATYAYYYEDEAEIDFKEGEGINGQVALDKKLLILSDIPQGYAKVYSGLGESYPNHIGLWPIVQNDETKYLVEFATFENIDSAKVNILKKLESIITEKEF